MLLDKINQTTEASLSYYKKVVEVEGAIIAFNMDLVQRKLNELAVITFKLNNTRDEMIQCFESESGLSWTEENFHKYCSQNISVEIASKNLIGYLEGTQKQLKTLNETLALVQGVTEKYHNADNALTGSKPSKDGAWSRKANLK